LAVDVLLPIAIVASLSLAHAGPKEDAYQVVEKWSKAFTDADVGREGLGLAEGSGST
jgi:hypothetical protein